MAQLSKSDLQATEVAITQWRNEPVHSFLHRRARKNSPYIFSIWLLPHGLRSYATVPKADDRVLFWSLTRLYGQNGNVKGALLPPVALKYMDLLDSYREMFAILKQQAEQEKKIQYLETLLAYGKDRINDIELLLGQCRKIKQSGGRGI